MIELKTSDFRSAVALAAMIPERRNTIPILSTLRCRANGALEISGTDLDCTLEASVPREAGEEASFVLADFRFVAKAVGAAGEKAMMINPSAEALTVEAGSLSVREKRVFHTDDWPADCGIVVEETFSATLSRDHIGQIARVVTAISQEETRYYLNGVYFHHIDGWNYRVVTTDGHRMMMVDLALPDATGSLDGLIIPKKAVRVLLQALGKADSIRLAAGFGRRANRETTTAPERTDAPRIGFEGEVGRAAIRLSSKTIDGTFPDYSRVIPKANDVHAMFAVDELRRGIQAVSRPEKGVRAVKLAFVKDAVRITSYFPETSVDAAIDVPAEHNALADFSIGFNGQYLLDMLSAIRGDEVAFELADAAAPTLIRDPADTAFTGVLMPMRV